METFLFFIRHTPFWAIPLLLISAEFGYLFWIRKKKNLVFVCATLACISLVASFYYFVAGGPEKSVNKVIKVKQYYFDD